MAVTANLHIGSKNGVLPYTQWGFVAYVPQQVADLNAFDECEFNETK